MRLSGLPHLPTGASVIRPLILTANRLDTTFVSHDEWIKWLFIVIHPPQPYWQHAQDGAQRCEEKYRIGVGYGSRAVPVKVKMEFTGTVSRAPIGSSSSIHPKSQEFHLTVIPTLGGQCVQIWQRAIPCLDWDDMEIN